MTESAKLLATDPPKISSSPQTGTTLLQPGNQSVMNLCPRQPQHSPFSPGLVKSHFFRFSMKMHLIFKEEPVSPREPQYIQLSLTWGANKRWSSTQYMSGTALQARISGGMYPDAALRPYDSGGDGQGTGDSTLWKCSSREPEVRESFLEDATSELHKAWEDIQEKVQESHTGRQGNDAPLAIRAARHRLSSAPHSALAGRRGTRGYLRGREDS